MKPRDPRLFDLPVRWSMPCQMPRIEAQKGLRSFEKVLPLNPGSGSAKCVPLLQAVSARRSRISRCSGTSGTQIATSQLILIFDSETLQAGGQLACQKPPTAFHFQPAVYGQPGVGSNCPTSSRSHSELIAPASVLLSST